MSTTTSTKPEHASPVIAEEWVALLSPKEHRGPNTTRQTDLTMTVYDR
jgi:hypothetical protein